MINLVSIGGCIIIMKGRPNNLAKTLLRAKSPPPPAKQDLPNNKSPDRPTAAIRLDPQRYSSSDSKPKIPLNNDVKQERKGRQLQSVCAVAGKQEDDNTTEQSSSQRISYVAGEYQLQSYDLFKRKNVQFDERPTEFQGVRVSADRGDRGSSRNSSILKNATRVLDRSALSSQKSLSLQNSFTARNKCRLVAPAPDSANLAIRKKYDSLVEQLRGKGEKYIDDLFPPVEASLYATSVHKRVNLARTKEEIVWLRLPEIFPGRSLRVFKRGGGSQGRVVGGGLSAGYLAECFNAVGGCSELLGSMFQTEQVNPQGIYLVRIYQQHSWRYVIVDDLIPSLKRKARIKRQEKYSPAFLNVTAAEGEPIYLWPFLLEKAYANYYNCYENLNYGNTLDFLAELTGTAYSQMHLLPNGNNKPDLARILSYVTRHATEGAPLLGLLEGKEGKEGKEKHYVALSVVRESFTADCLFGYREPTSEEIRTVQADQLSSTFSTLFLYPRGEYPHVTTCPVYPPKVIRPRNKPPKNGKFLSIPTNDTTSLRAFTILKRARVRVQIRQKENRFYYQCGITDYLWVRCLFLQKEYDGGYRWLSGRYASQKHIVFQEALEAGEYLLVVMTEWREKHNRELTILLASDCEFLKIDRKNYIKEEKVVELACMDLAQRFGKLSQINKSICAYTYLCEDSALIIQNIINQRTKGDVTIMRSISGLRSKVEILPFNPEFEVEAPEEYAVLEKQQCRKVIDQSVEIDIGKGESYTVVLRMRGGIDRKFFKAFNFG